MSGSVYPFAGGHGVELKKYHQEGIRGVWKLLLDETRREQEGDACRSGNAILDSLHCDLGEN